MDDETIEREVRAFLQHNFPLAGDQSSVPSNGSLIDLGVVDSTGVLEIVGFLEGRFGLEIPIDDISPEHLDTVADIVGYVGARLSTEDGDVAV